jgi:tetratricopeptide (TPR) repeat protein
MRDRGDLDGAIAEFRTAISLDPTYAMVHNNLGVALNAKGDREGAIVEYKAAIALDPKSALAHNNLGNALTFKGNLEEAIAEFRTAIALDPKLATAHSNLGFALQLRGDLDGAIAEFHAAIALDEKSAQAHNNLGNALREKGDLGGAVAAYREAERYVPKGVGTNRAETERWIKLLPRVDAVGAGRAEPATAAEAADFSRIYRLSYQKRYAASARLYTTACATDQEYATDASTLPLRYEAARSAALAGCGQGADAPDDASARAALRWQALAWLETNQKLLMRRLASGTAGDQKSVVVQLSACLAVRDLAGVRPGAARDGWSPPEAAAWDAHWTNARALLAMASEAPRAEPPLK